MDLEGRLDRRIQLFDAALERLEQAAPFAKPLQQREVVRLADLLRRSDDGLEALAERAPRFHQLGVFEGGPWGDVSRLQPALVPGSLDFGGPTSAMETLDLLRVASLARGTSHDSGMTAHEAQEFIDEVVALNIDRVAGQEKEEFSTPATGLASDEEARASAEAVQRVCRWLFKHAASSKVMEVVVDELRQMIAQRPILTQPIRDLIRAGAKLGSEDPAVERRLKAYKAAIDTPTPLATKHADLQAYAATLEKADQDTLHIEAESAATNLRSTGLGSRHHAVLLRHLVRTMPEFVPVTLGLNAVGEHEWDAHRDKVRDLVELAVYPGTAQSVYGIARLLERSLLSRREVAHGLERLADLPLHEDVVKDLLRVPSGKDQVEPHAWLVAGALSVLGQPLGVGQGRNPTCQSARGISLWSQHRPGYLLSVIATAARDGHVTMDFLGESIDSSDLMGGLAHGVVTGLDPVSQVLVPHLDRLYDEMMRRVANHPEDGHRWVNPALYGRLVPSAFVSVFDRLTGAVVEHEAFVRRFLRCYDLDVNGGQRPLYPVPVGIIITGAHGRFLGFHAVSLQRIRPDRNGNGLRAFFYNPNNEGRQNWGQGIEPQVFGNGEHEGESSLPLDQFASRVYAFHFDPYVLEDSGTVDPKRVEAVSRLAQESWGEAFTWM